MIIRNFIFLIISGFLFSCSQETEWHINNSEGSYLKVDSTNSSNEDKKMLSEIAPYKHKLDSAMSGIITYTDKEYFKKKPNGTLNNLVCDMVFDVIVKRYKDSPYKPDFCLLNYGGLRRPLPKGAISRSAIFQLMPFENESVICRLSAKQMKQLFTYLQKSNGQPIANMKVYYKQDKFSRAIINGNEFDTTKSYNVLTSDYTAKGGDRMNFFLEADTMILCGSLLRNDIFSYIENLKGQKLIASEEERIFFE